MNWTHPLSVRMFANVRVCMYAHMCMWLCVYVCVCVGMGESLEMWAHTFDRASLEVYFEPYNSPEDNLTRCQDLQRSQDEVQVCEGQVTWLQLEQPALLKLVAAPAVLCSLGCQDDTAPWK